MTADEASAQLGAMRDAARRVNETSVGLAGIRAGVLSTVEATASGYDSPGARLFRDVMTQWHGDFAMIVQGLDRISEALGANDTNYQQAVDEERRTINEIAALLNPATSTGSV